MFNISGTITLGGTAQYIDQIPPRPMRRGFFIQNHSSGDLWVMNSATIAATMSQPSIRIPAGAMYETPSSGDLGGGAYEAGPITIIGATTGQAFTGRTW
jgi:hypothetical protein